MPYDYLILCTGQQFQVPVPTGADISTLVTTSEVTVPKVTRYTDPLPSTVFTITTEKDCENALNYIRREFLSRQGKIEACETIHYLHKSHNTSLLPPPPPQKKMHNHRLKFFLGHEDVKGGKRGVFWGLCKRRMVDTVISHTLGTLEVLRHSWDHYMVLPK